MSKEKTVARIISEFLEESGGRYDLANSLSIKVLAMDLQTVLSNHEETK